MPPTRTAITASPTAKGTIDMPRMALLLARDLEDLVHALVRGRDQGAVEQVGFETDLVLVPVVIQRGEYGAPVFFLFALRHHALALDLKVEHALLGQQVVAVRISDFLALGVVRV